MKRKGARLLWELRDSWDPTGANVPRRLSASPMESEQPEAECRESALLEPFEKNYI